MRAFSILVLILCILPGCAGRPLGPGSRPMAAAAQSPPAPAAALRKTDEERARYVMGALADMRPPGAQGRRRIATGTGFFIAPDRVLTNFHVVAQCGAVTVGNNREGTEIDAELEAGDERADLAVLSASDADARPARFTARILEHTGAHLGMVGYPSRGLPVLNAELDRISASFADLAADRPVFSFSGPVRSGNSGSPVLEASGSVLGVVTAKVDTVSVYRYTGIVVSDVGFAIAGRSVLDFLRRNRIPFRTAEPGTPLSDDALLATARGFVRQIGCWS